MLSAETTRALKEQFDPVVAHEGNDLLELSVGAARHLPTIAKCAWVDTPHYFEYRNAIVLKTTYPLKVLATPTEAGLEILGKLAESHEAREKLVDIGLSKALVEVASSTRGASVNLLQINWWIWMMSNHINYMKEIPPSLVFTMSEEILRYISLPRGRANLKERRMSYLTSMLVRIVLRGDPSLVTPIAGLCLRVAALMTGQNTGDMYDRLVLRAALENSPLLLPSIVDTDRLVLSEMPLNKLIRIAALEKLSRRHLKYSGFVRPGESLLLYTTLLSSEREAVAYVGINMLYVLLDSVNPWDHPPYETAASQICAKQALETRAKLDEALTNNNNPPRRQDMYRKPPHQYVLLTECILRVTRHPHPLVKRQAMACLDMIPARIHNQVVWSPSLHAYFPSNTNDLVKAMLLVCQRCDVPAALCISFILPFACCMRVE